MGFPQCHHYPLDDPHNVLGLCGRRFATLPFGLGARGSLGWAHSIARPWVPTRNAYGISVTVFEFLAGSKSDLTSDAL